MDSLNQIIKTYVDGIEYKDYFHLSKIFGLPLANILELIYPDTIIEIDEQHPLLTTVIIYNKKNEILHLFDNNGYWEECEYDNRNRLITEKNVNGIFIKYYYLNGCVTPYYYSSIGDNSKEFIFLKKINFYIDYSLDYIIKNVSLFLHIINNYIINVWKKLLKDINDR